MAPQTSIPPAANVLGTFGTILWCVQLLPQIWHNWKYKNTDGMPGFMMLLWAIAMVPMGAYEVIQNFNIPIQAQPQALGTLALVTWAQILIYHHKWSVQWASTVAGGVLVVFGGVEALLILTLRGPYKRGLEWPVTLIGTLAAVIMALGTLPLYPEIWKRRGRVVGVNFVFLGMDFSGAIFSLAALGAQYTFDILGGSLYIVVLVLEAGVFLSHIIWLFRTRKLRRRAKLEGKDFDDLPEARRYQYNPPEKKHRSVFGPTDAENGNTNLCSAATDTHSSTPVAFDGEQAAQEKAA